MTAKAGDGMSPKKKTEVLSVRTAGTEKGLSNNELKAKRSGDLGEKNKMQVKTAEGGVQKM